MRLLVGDTHAAQRHFQVLAPGSSQDMCVADRTDLWAIGRIDVVTIGNEALYQTGFNPLKHDNQSRADANQVTSGLYVRDDQAMTFIGEAMTGRQRVNRGS